MEQDHLFPIDSCVLNRLSGNRGYLGQLRDILLDRRRLTRLPRKRQTSEAQAR
jgi:hypothetical protein